MVPAAATIIMAGDPHHSQRHSAVRRAVAWQNKCNNAAVVAILRSGCSKDVRVTHRMRCQCDLDVLYEFLPSFTE